MPADTVKNSILYPISSREDLINGFSPEGYELPADSFLSFVELECAALPWSGPISLTVSGAPLSEQDIQAAERAIRVQYDLQKAENSQAFRNCVIKTFWFLVSFIASAIILMLPNMGTDFSEVATNFCYLPFWYFGYRVITYPLQELIPLWRERIKVNRLAAMELIFPTEDGSSVTCTTAHAVSPEEYFMEDGKMLLECRASSPDELLVNRGHEGAMRISDGLAAYLELALPFVKLNTPVCLLVHCPDLTAEDEASIKTATVTYLSRKESQAEGAVTENRIRITAYTIGLIVAAIFLGLIGNAAGVAIHEFLLIIFWFFGDYLIEFMLTEKLDAKKAHALRRHLKVMEVRFAK